MPRSTLHTSSMTHPQRHCSSPRTPSGRQVWERLDTVMSRWRPHCRRPWMACVFWSPLPSLTISASGRCWPQHLPHPPTWGESKDKTHSPRKHTARCAQKLEMLAPGRDWPRATAPGLCPVQDATWEGATEIARHPLPNAPSDHWGFTAQKKEIPNWCSLCTPKSNETQPSLKKRVL